MKDYAYLGSSLGVMSVGGHPIMFDTRDLGMVNLLMNNNVYEPDVWFAVSRLATPGSCFIDVGANVGIHTVLAAKRVTATGQVFAFEPNRNIFDILLRNARLNGIAGRTTIFQKAAYCKAGHMQFSADPEQHRVGALVIEGAMNFGTEPYEVEVIELDSLLPTIKSDRVVIKVDVEGREPGVLLGAKEILQTKEVALIFEYQKNIVSSTGIDVEEFFQTLTAYGFEFRKIVPSEKELVDISVDELLSMTSHVNLVALKS